VKGSEHRLYLEKDEVAGAFFIGISQPLAGQVGLPEAAMGQAPSSIVLAVSTAVPAPQLPLWPALFCLKPRRPLPGILAPGTGLLDFMCFQPDECFVQLAAPSRTPIERYSPPAVGATV